MFFQDKDTIAAIATPAGEGGIAIIRVSGPDAIEIVSKHFKGKKKLTEVKSWYSVSGKYYFREMNHQPVSENFYDEVIITIFRAPYSYTTEDVLEINCHGGKYLAQKVLSTVINSGARLAQPGEFTFRAFMNGRIDLAQAEAIADVIKSENDFAIQNSIKQLEGALSQLVGQLRDYLMETVSLLELELDFAEEDVEFASRKEIKHLLENTIAEIKKLIGSFERSKILRQGARVVLVGKPNVGKSSILNAMLSENRAIVTEIPGTTRDILEEQINIDGTVFRLIDTAGIIESNNPIEVEGIRRTNQNIQEADIVLMVFDRSENLDEYDFKILGTIKKLINKKIILGLLNKSDLPFRLEGKQISNVFSGLPLFEISAKTNTGISELGKELVSISKEKYLLQNEAFVVTNLRHQRALSAAMEALKNARTSLKNGLSAEFIVSDLRIALDVLGEIVGIVKSEDILNNIFAKFCIGK